MVALAAVDASRQTGGQPLSGQPAGSQPAAGQQAAGPTGFSAAGPLKFREQEIARDFGVGYAVASGDVNGDKKPDILDETKRTGK